MLLVATLSILSRLRLWSAQSDELIGGLIMNLQLVITIYAINSNKFDVAYFKTKGKLPSIWDYALP